MAIKVQTHQLLLVTVNFVLDKIITIIITNLTLPVHYIVALQLFFSLWIVLGNDE